MRRFLTSIGATLLWLGLSACGGAAKQELDPPEVLVAVASNFAATLDALSTSFTASTGIKVVASVGSTGKHTVQIERGAPFDLFLAADGAHPQALETHGLVIPGTRFTYARGRLMLWSLDPDRVVDASSLQPSEERDRGATLAIANPELAPYGLAARQFLEHQGLWEDYSGLRVMGENVGQAYRFALSGNASMALIAASQIASQTEALGHGWLVPSSLHDPILQQAVLLRESPEARSFWTFLQSEEAAIILRAHGYEVPETS
ncbi:MAG: molybdate ABC transporter substrate-binding protein [Planctomycetota bacterium]